MTTRIGLRATISCFAMATLIVAMTSRVAVAVDPGVACAITKQRSVAKNVKATTKCYELAQKNDTAVDGACLLAAADKMAATFGKADDKGGCLVASNTATVAGLLTQGMDDLLVAFPLSGGACATTQRKIAARFFGELTKCSAGALKSDEYVDRDCLQRAADRASQAVSNLADKGICAGDPVADHAIEVLATTQARVVFETPAAACSDECAGMIDSVSTSHTPGYLATFGDCVIPLNYSPNAPFTPIDNVVPSYEFELLYEGSFCEPGPGPIACMPNREAVFLGDMVAPNCVAQSHSLVFDWFPPTYREWASCARFAMAAYQGMTGLPDPCSPPSP